MVYSAGALTLRAGCEAIRTVGAANQTGYGLSAGYTAGDMTVNGNYAKSNDRHASSTGLNLVQGNFGLGFVQDKDTSNSHKTNTVYAAYSFPLLNVPGATVTPAVSHSTSTGVANVNAVRVRLNYAF